MKESKHISWRKRILQTFILLLFTTVSFAQSTISGKVTDASTNEALPGVNIVIKGTTNGTVSDIDGNYSISAPSDATIQFSFIGYQPLEIPVNGKSSINAKLDAQSLGLEEVVAIGYGSVKRSEITGAISSVKSEELQKTSAIGLDMALQGKAAGIQVIPNSGTPGAKATVNIRGATSINNYSPLYVVDGVPMGDVYDISTADIESIEILKDASATGIYGTQAAGGVILIKTKAGKAGKTRISINSSYGTQQVWNKMEVLNGPDYVRAVQEAFGNDGMAVKSPFNRSGYDTEQPDTMPTYDWGSRAYQTGMMRNNQVSISGGSDELTYYLSFNDQYQEGIIKSTDFHLSSFRMNNVYKANDWLKITQTLNITQNTKTTVPEWGIWPWGRTSFLGYAWTPTVPFFDEEGGYSTSPFQSAPHVDQRLEQDANSNTSRLIQNVFGAQIKIIDGLTFNSKYAVSFSNSFNKDYDKPYDYGNESKEVATYSVKPRQSTSHLITNFLTYAKKVGDHDFSIMAGAEQSMWYSDGLDVSSQGLVSTIDFPLVDDVDVNQNQATKKFYDKAGERVEFVYPTEFYSVNQWYSQSRRYSYFGRFTYNYASKYFLTGTVRRDGTSAFPENQKWGVFPAFSTGWNITEEDFMEGLPLDRLMLRAGWGQVGNDRVLGASAIKLKEGEYVSGGVPLTHALPESPGNPNATWETTSTSNIGIDFGMLSNRLTGTVEVYNRITDDMLVKPETFYYLGYPGKDNVNLAKMSNKGLELSLNYQQKVGDFSFNVGGNISFLKNEVLALYGENAFLSYTDFAGYNGLQRTEVGRELSEFYVLQMDGVFQSQEEVDNYTWTGIPEGKDEAITRVIQDYAKPGDIKFKDLNNDGMINEEDRDFSGSPHAKFTYGMNFSASWKMIDFSMMLQGVYGNKILTTTPYFFDFELQSNMSQHYFDNRWTESNPTNDYPRLTFQNYGKNSQPSTYLIRDGSFLRCRNLEIGVTIPNTEKIKISKARVFARAQNPFTITKYQGGLDPEVGSTNGNSLSQGFDAGIYPQAKSMLVGIQLDF